MASYYTVKVGRQTGIFKTNAAAFKQVNGYANSQMQKFSNLADAKAYLHSPITSQTYYVVLTGNYPGIYTNKQLANKQLIGHSDGSIKAFTNLSKARYFLLKNIAKVIKNKLQMLLPQYHKNGKLYLVTRGRHPGIYTDFTIAHQQVNNYPNGYLKRYNNLSSLRKAVRISDLNLWKEFYKQCKPIDGKYYVVIKGIRPGIYTNYDDAVAQTASYSEGHFQVFNSLTSAEYFVLTHQMFVTEPMLKSVHLDQIPKKDNELEIVKAICKHRKNCYYGFRAGKYSQVFTNEQELLDALKKHPNGWFLPYNSSSKATKFISEYNPELSKSVIFKAIVYTDGGFVHNHIQHGSWAYLIDSKFQQTKIHDSGSLFKVNGINNYMELYALYKALKELIKLNYNKQPIRFILDSQYVLTTIINHNCQSSANNNAMASLWQDVNTLLAQFDTVCFDWTKGHAGNPGNEFVDSKARQELKIAELSYTVANIN